MKKLIYTLEITTTMFFIVLAFALGVMAGWQSASETVEHKPQTMTLRKVNNE